MDKDIDKNMGEVAPENTDDCNDDWSDCTLHCMWASILEIGGHPDEIVQRELAKAARKMTFKS